MKISSQSYCPETAIMICLLVPSKYFFCLYAYVCSCVFYKMKSSYTYSRSSNNVVLFNLVSLKLMRKKITQLGALSVWFAGSPPMAWVFSEDSHPKRCACKGRLRVYTTPFWVNWVCVNVPCNGRVSCPRWILLCSLSCWERLHSSMTRTGISRLENHSLCFYSFFLNVCIAHVYFSVWY